MHKVNFFNAWYWENGISTFTEMQLGCHIINKISSKGNHDLNMRSEPVIVLKGNKENMPYVHLDNLYQDDPDSTGNINNKQVVQTKQVTSN